MVKFAEQSLFSFYFYIFLLKLIILAIEKRYLHNYFLKKAEQGAASCRDTPRRKQCLIEVQMLSTKK